MKAKSSFHGEQYAGYKISLRIVREGIGEYEPFTFTCPGDVYDFMKDIRDFDRERFYSICLDGKNQVVHCEEVSSGTLTSTVAHPREIFKSAILSSSSNIILAHNHTSGDPKPSTDDLLLTERICECGDLLGIELLDHVIIGADSYYSFRDSGDFEKFRKKGQHQYCLFDGD